MNAPNIANRTIFTGDNLPVMRGINSESVDLIYLDPPFNSNRNYAAPIGSPAEGAGFKDIWTLDDIKEVQVEELKGINYGLHAIITAARYSNGPAMTAYLTVMGIRLLEIHRLLKTTGTAYLHCDPTASHYIKGMMDAVFGAESFRNEIVWSYAGGGIPKYDFPRKHDIILRYSKSDTRTFNSESVRVPYTSSYAATVFAGDDTRAPGRTYTRNPAGKIIEGLVERHTQTLRTGKNRLPDPETAGAARAYRQSQFQPRRSDAGPLLRMRYRLRRRRKVGTSMGWH